MLRKSHSNNNVNDVVNDHSNNINNVVTLADHSKDEKKKWS